VFLAALGCGEGDSPEPPTLPELCESASSIPRIINGQTCSPFSTTVGRLDLFDDEDNRVTCSAVIVSATRVVTAAHCFDDIVFRATLVAGEESREVVRVVYHPDFLFRGDRFEHDIAIADLDAPLSFPIKPITLAPAPRIGETMYIFGYGRTTTDEFVSPRNEDLFAGTMTLSAVSDLFIEALYDGSGANTCQGDSGGPAFVFDTATGQLGLSGLVSSGTIESCSPGDTSVFTNLLNQSNREFLAREAPEIIQPAYEARP
jgi:secreted trypsin-like serine protease